MLKELPSVCCIQHVEIGFMSLSCNLTKSVITRHYTYFNGKKLGQRYKHNGHIGNHSTPEVKIKISIDHQTIRLVIYDKF